MEGTDRSEFPVCLRDQTKVKNRYFESGRVRRRQEAADCRVGRGAGGRESEARGAGTVPHAGQRDCQPFWAVRQANSHCALSSTRSPTPAGDMVF